MNSLDEKKRDELEKQLDELKNHLIADNSKNPPVRDFAAKYALIFANEKYDELRKIDEGLSDLRWTKIDLMNAQATMDSMGFL